MKFICKLELGKVLLNGLYKNRFMIHPFLINLTVTYHILCRDPDVKAPILLRRPTPLDGDRGRNGLHNSPKT